MSEMIIIECPNCEILSNIEIIGSFEDEDTISMAKGKYSFLKCPACNHPLITFQVDVGDGWEEPEIHYPRDEIVTNISIPGSIRVLYKAALRCFKAGAFSETALACRKVIEGIVEEQGIKGQNLFSALKEMKNKGIIENNLYELAEIIRNTGNQAAHEISSSVSPDVTFTVLEFTKALLENIYIYRVIYEEFIKLE